MIVRAPVEVGQHAADDAVVVLAVDDNAGGAELVVLVGNATESVVVFC